MDALEHHEFNENYFLDKEQKKGNFLIQITKYNHKLKWN